MKLNWFIGVFYSCCWRLISLFISLLMLVMFKTGGNLLIVKLMTTLSNIGKAFLFMSIFFITLYHFFMELNLLTSNDTSKGNISSWASMRLCENQREGYYLQPQDIEYSDGPGLLHRFTDLVEFAKLAYKSGRILVDYTAAMASRHAKMMDPKNLEGHDYPYDWLPWSFYFNLEEIWVETKALVFLVFWFIFLFKIIEFRNCLFSWNSFGFKFWMKR